MKTWLKNILAGLMLAAVASTASAQTNSVSITRIVTGNAESVASVTVSAAGSGYTTAPTVTFSGGGGGSGAAATATISSLSVISFTVSTGGAGYTSAPTVTVSGGGGSGATATATISGGAVTGITVTAGGTGFTSTPTVVLSGGGFTTAATATATIGGTVTGISVTNGGSGYTSAPTVTLTGGGGSGATATAVRGSTGQAFSNPNEAYGASGTTIYITGLGTGTFPSAGWTYNFKVNNVSIGQITSVPGGTAAVIPWAPPQPGTYFISVQATGIGDPVTSLAVRYFATGTAITSPVNGSIVPNGSSVVIEATATPQPLGNGQNAFVQKIDFFADGSSTAFASDTVAPFSAIYTPTTLGSHTIEAKAYDNLGQQISPNGTATRSLTVVTPVGTAPTIAISSPANNSTIAVPASAVTVSVDASPGTTRITQVELYIDGVLFGTDSSFPYSFSWLPTVVGSYRLSSLAYDQGGNVVASSTNTVLVSAPPTVAVTQPSANSTVTGGTPVQLSATATTATAGATISSVQFFVDGTFVGQATSPTSGTTFSVPATLTQRKDSAGTVLASVITALASDSNGLSTTSVGISVSVTAGGGGGAVVIGVAPTVSLTAPTVGSAFLVNSLVNLTASASDTNPGKIVSVDFLVDGKSVGTDVTFPYAATWTPTNLGRYDVTARATDDDGNAVSSKTVSVFVVDATAATNVYSGTYSRLSGANIELGNFALVTVGTTSATFMAYSTTVPSRTYYYSGGTVTSTGSVSFPATSSAGSLAATAIDSGVNGTFDGANVTFVGRVASSSSMTVAAGYYQGSLNGRNGSRIVGIVGLDGAIFVYGTDGSISDVGSGTVNSSGAFSLTTKAGTIFSGTVSPTSGLMTGSMTTAGTSALSFTGALATGGTFSDGVLRGLSTRGFVGTGGNVMIAGFVIGGTVSKQVVIRGIGPSLTAGGVSGVLANPKLDLFSGSNLLASNDDWGGANLALMNSVGLAAPATSESVIVRTLAPGVYTAQLSGVSSGTGVGMVEIYDTDTVSAFTAQKVSAISTRGFVNSGDGALIAGFVVNGSSSKKVLIEAVGPSLGIAGLLTDPVLQIIRNGAVIRENDNWEVGNDSSLVIDAAARSGATPLAAGGKDAAILINLQPGTYTAVVTGSGGGTGIALINVYEVP
jgi:hypothetical protein